MFNTKIIIIVISLLIIVGCDQPSVKDGYFNEVSTVLPLETKYTKLGNQEVTSEEFDSGEENFSKYKIWYPNELVNSFNAYPIVLLVNGTGVPYSKYEPIFEHLASWGFVVIGNNEEWTATGQSASLMLDFITLFNTNPQSVLYNKLNLEKIGISGHSQGGVGAIHAVTNFDNSSKYLSIYTASTTSLSMIESWNIDKSWIYDVSKIEIPYFMVAATGNIDAKTIAPLSSLEENFSKLNNNELTVMARRKNIDHGNTLDYADGYMTAWFRFTLLNDLEAAKVFIGNSPEIQQNSTNWQDVRIKNKD
jgi:hypothetical protein